jgi:hypothetical protein
MTGWVDDDLDELEAAACVQARDVLAVGALPDPRMNREQTVRFRFVVGARPSTTCLVREKVLR